MLIDRTGKVVAEGFDNLQSIGEGRVLASRGVKWGFADFAGNVRVPLIYDSTGNGFHGGLTSLAKEGKWGYVDLDGKVVVPFQFDEAGSFFESGLAPARMGRRTGFIDRSGKFRFLLSYRYSAGFIYSDVAPFWRADGKFGYP